MFIGQRVPPRLTAIVMLVGLVFGSRPSLGRAQNASTTSEDPAPVGWAGDPSYLFSAPTGRTLGRGELLVGVREVPHAPTLLLDYGLTDRITLATGFLVESYGGDQDGEAIVGAHLQLGSAGAPLAIHARSNLVIGHWLGRRLGDVVVTGARHWGDERKAFTAGAGWRGYRDFCRPEWEGCTEEWHGNGFALVGGYFPLGDRVQLVSENELRLLDLSTATGVRAGIGGLTVGVATRCVVYAGFGVGAECDDLRLSASYRVRLHRE